MHCRKRVRSDCSPTHFIRRLGCSQKEISCFDTGLEPRAAEFAFFDYRGATREPEPLIDREVGERVFDRILSMLINEAIDAVHWRVASPADIDLAVTKGVNYPKGLLAWGDERGLDHVLEALVALQTEYGEDRYRPSVLLKRMVRNGGRFTT